MRTKITKHVYSINIRNSNKRTKRRNTYTQVELVTGGYSLKCNKEISEASRATNHPPIEI